MTMRHVPPVVEHKREATAKFENFKVAEAVQLAQRVSKGLQIWLD